MKNIKLTLNRETLRLVSGPTLLMVHSGIQADGSGSFSTIDTGIGGGVSGAQLSDGICHGGRSEKCRTKAFTNC